jgi:hypothetical protein
MSICLLLFANSIAEDYLYITLDRLKKFFPKIKSYMGIDSSITLNKVNKFYTFDEIIIYNQSDTWTKKMNYILSFIKEDYVFLLIDNNIFVDIFSEEKLNLYINTIVKTNIDQLRMLPGGVTLPSISNKDNIYKNNESSYVFSVQPAIWKKSTLIDIMEKFLNVDYREIELTATPYAIKFNNYFIYTEKDIEYNEKNFSFGCPVIHALTFGKWVNESEFYKKCLDNIFKEYSVKTNRKFFLD